MISPPQQRDTLYLCTDVLFAAAARTDAGLRRLWQLAEADVVKLISSPRTVQEATTALMEIGTGSAELERLLDAVTLVPDTDRKTIAEGPHLPEWLLYLGPAFVAGATHCITALSACAEVRDMVYGGHLVVMTPAEYLSQPPGSPRFVVRPPQRRAAPPRRKAR